MLKVASENQPHLPSLEAFKWRVDVGISTRFDHTQFICKAPQLLHVICVRCRVSYLQVIG